MLYRLNLGLFLFLDSELGEESKVVLACKHAVNAVRESDEKKVESLVEKA